MVKRGDTLIEVTLAVGIFSMIAVAVVAIMSNGTSETQTALETTLAREEIDIQAEALRFIQASASAETTSTTDTSFRGLWNKIKDNSIDLSDLNPETKNNVLNFAPNDCAEPYQNDWEWLNNQHAFFIDPSELSGDNKTMAYVNTRNRFYPTETYPHIAEKSSSGLGKSQAEGIYVVGVKGTNGSDSSSSSIGSSSAASASKDYYDFYIRTCWYGSNADRPSTISTVIRLLSE